MWHRGVVQLAVIGLGLAWGGVGGPNPTVGALSVPRSFSGDPEDTFSVRATPGDRLVNELQTMQVRSHSVVYLQSSQ